MVRPILVATGFVLTAWAVGLLLLVGYEASLIFPGGNDRARRSLDRHATYIVATFVAGASR
jgi:hypothetical protein